MEIKKLKSFLFKETSSAPLIVFRIAFGVMMFLSLVRFAANGWIDSLYVQPKFFFTYYGFEWIKPLNATGMYIVFGLMMLAALFLAAGPDLSADQCLSVHCFAAGSEGSRVAAHQAAGLAGERVP